jgi:hypothetical protein
MIAYESLCAASKLRWVNAHDAQPASFNYKAGSSIRRNNTCTKRNENMRVMVLSALLAIGLGVAGMSSASAAPAANGINSAAAGSLLHSAQFFIYPAPPSRVRCRTVRVCRITHYGRRVCHNERVCRRYR